MYAGVARGADFAAWKQVARDELARATGANYAETLLDLVKAIDRVTSPSGRPLGWATRSGSSDSLWSPIGSAESSWSGEPCLS